MSDDDEGEEDEERWKKNRTIVTHFAEDVRIYISLRHEDLKRPIQHIQGVDTFHISRSGLFNNIMNYTQVVSIVQFFHQVCPLSFYQDDYILSFIFNVANFTIKSIWDNYKVAGHIENVSKSNFQVVSNTIILYYK